MKPVIITVDDEQIILRSLKFAIKGIFGTEFNIESCESGEEALKVINELKSDGIEIPLIITDYIMPGMKGDKLLEIVNQKYPEILSIMLTGLASLDGITNAVNNANLFQFLSKPWENKQFELSTRKAISFYNMNSELIKKQKDLEVSNKKLKTLDDLKRNFLYLLSHELYTPLTGIFLNLDLILRNNTDENVIQPCQRISTSANRLKRISDLSLLITKLKNNNYVLDYNLYSINDIIKAMMYKYGTELQQKNLKMSNNPIEKESFFRFDLSLIEFAIDSIINNAIKYSNPNGNIEINYTNTESFLILSIKDEGPGFEKEILESPFRLFVSDEMNHHSIGIGLCLTTTKIIMDYHGFGLFLSNHPDGGANVDLVFPH
jgi:two-component system sensor histidine kinase/response regulator